jgi:uncharacterized protein (DUF488 family)
MENIIYTIGYSTHSIQTFEALLSKYSISALVDVRTSPYSKFKPEFNKQNLAKSLKQSKVAYLFMGEELGARSIDPGCYINGRVSFTLLAQTENFRRGISRLSDGMQEYVIALMCAEKDPITCHRTILISRYLEKVGITVKHILDNGLIETTSDIEKRLLKLYKLEQLDFFTYPSDAIETAYLKQEHNISYNLKSDDENELENKW